MSLWKPVLVVIAGAEIAAAVWLARTVPQADEGRPSHEVATTRYTNTQGGYSFNYPSSWRLSERGAIAKVKAPDGDVLISFGQGPRGELVDASNQFTGLLEKSYSAVRFSPTDSRWIGPNPSLLRTGTGTNEAGVRLKFWAITVHSMNRNYAIAVFRTTHADSDKVRARVWQIVNSFRTVTPQ